MTRRDYQPGQGPVRGLVVAFAFSALFWGFIAGVVWAVTR